MPGPGEDEHREAGEEDDEAGDGDGDSLPVPPMKRARILNGTTVGWSCQRRAASGSTAATRPRPRSRPVLRGRRPRHPDGGGCRSWTRTLPRSGGNRRPEPDLGEDGGSRRAVVAAPTVVVAGPGSPPPPLPLFPPWSSLGEALGVGVPACVEGRPVALGDSWSAEGLDEALAGTWIVVAGSLKGSPTNVNAPAERRPRGRCRRRRGR